jgi:hypothetical protein
MLERVAATAYGITRRNGMRKLLLSLACLHIMLVPAFADEAADVDSAFPEMARQLSAADRRLTNKTVAVYGFEVIGRPGDSYALYATEKLTMSSSMPRSSSFWSDRGSTRFSRSRISPFPARWTPGNTRPEPTSTGRAAATRCSSG